MGETMATGTALAPANEDARQVIADFTPVWGDMQKNGMVIGRLLHKWTTSEAFKPWNGGCRSNGEGLVGILLTLKNGGIDIPRHIAMYWLAEYKFKQGLISVPCPSCEMTFPSTSKMRKHERTAHPQNATPVPQEPESVQEPIFTTETLEDFSNLPTEILPPDSVQEPSQNDPVPVPDTVTDTDEEYPSDGSDTKRLQARFLNTGILVRASNAKSGLKSCQGKFDLLGLTEKQVRQIAKMLSKMDEGDPVNIDTLQQVSLHGHQGIVVTQDDDYANGEFARVPECENGDCENRKCKDPKHRISTCHTVRLYIECDDCERKNQ